MRFPTFPAILFALAAIPARPAEAEPLPPWAAAAVNVESGVLWQVGSLTPLPYRLVPTQLAWRSRRAFGPVFADGSRLVVRHRLALIGTWIPSGPESHYVGFSASPSVEWWNAAGTWSWFGGSGGGFGWIDSRGVTGGQGQDFTLNWFIRAGVERVTKKDRRWSAGLMYQHLSNGGQTEPNPGIDALGFTLGYSRPF